MKYKTMLFDFIRTNEPRPVIKMVASAKKPKGKPALTSGEAVNDTK